MTDDFRDLPAFGGPRHGKRISVRRENRLVAAAEREPSQVICGPIVAVAANVSTFIYRVEVFCKGQSRRYALIPQNMSGDEAIDQFGGENIFSAAVGWF